MNKQIIELYKQAQEFAYKNISEEYWNTDNFHAVVSGKFAELIVKECAGVCHTHGWGMLEHGMSGHNIADDCGTLIKEHFGVEE